MKLIDSHCHVNFSAYKKDQDEVIQRCLDQEIGMIIVGTQSDTSKSAVDIVNQYEKDVFAAIGLHSAHAVGYGHDDDQELGFKPRQEVFDANYYNNLLESTDKIVAIGECGLDYYRMPEENKSVNKKVQYEAFMAQSEFAAINDLPLIIHCRDAFQDQLSALKEAEQSWGSQKKGVIHCFTGTYEQAKMFVDDGWYIGFTGIAVFAEEVAIVAKKLPLESILVETDAPYLAPPPYRGKRNEPMFVKFVVQDLARRRGIPFDEVAEITTSNAIKLFNLPHLLANT